MNLILTGTIVLGINNRFKEFFKWFTSYDLLWRGYMAIIQGFIFGENFRIHSHLASIRPSRGLNGSNVERMIHP